jgi:hypothetical protein
MQYMILKTIRDLASKIRRDQAIQIGVICASLAEERHQSLQANIRRSERVGQVEVPGQGARSAGHCVQS